MISTPVSGVWTLNLADIVLDPLCGKTVRLWFDLGCVQISSISHPTIVARRLNKVGGVIRQGNRWFLSEYAIGYSIFEYANQSALKHSRPTQVHWLGSTPHFDGTDNAVCEHDLLFYSSSSQRLYAMRLQPSTSSRRLRSISFPPLKRTIKQALYAHSYSLIDLESGGGYIWALYRDDTFLKVIKIECATLGIAGQWSLRHVHPKRVVNAFIACDFLYTVTQSSDSNVLSVVYDFESDIYVEPSKEVGSWKRHGIPSNVQYDPLSRTINVFDNGLIYTIDTKQT
ncbi:Myocilin [Toxocara canis]|uniref:Myocilin n=1 Tax=Toxocara canis TaxID=6265 RepID=A0A0B2V549_TOXCA|nr:Myocilin [Toxocara canis]